MIYCFTYHNLRFSPEWVQGISQNQVAHRENADGSTSRESAKDNERQRTEMLEEYHFDCANLQYECQL